MPRGAGEGPAPPLRSTLEGLSVPPNEDDSPRQAAPGAITALLEELARPDDAGEGGSARCAPAPSSVGSSSFASWAAAASGSFTRRRIRELGRTVAFKAVVAGARAATCEERLLHEAEAAARLSHPNIVTLYDVGRSECGPYLVLELLRGQTLAQRFAIGAVTVREALRIALEVAKGLAHAHARGVVHRDLTPGNVFLCHDGQVKVLDLGMAHAFGRRNVEGGTKGFMAPEQERGAPEDERTDVFALGVILYRMLAGQLPYDVDPRSQPGANAPPLQIRELPALAEPSRGCSRATRWNGRGTRERWRARSRRCSTTRALVGRPCASVDVQPRGAAAAASVAVLPFADLSPARDQEWLCDGIAEEILHVLAGLAGLRVASRSASFQFKGRTVDGREMARTIGVTTLLEGSVRKAGARVRITARLVGEEGYEHLVAHVRPGAF